MSWYHCPIAPPGAQVPIHHRGEEEEQHLFPRGTATSCRHCLSTPAYPATASGHAAYDVNH